MKYLICRPEGGINDILCQIQKCYVYCQKYNRHLVIDAKHSSSFNDDFSKFFKTLANNVILSGTDQLSIDLLSQCASIFPNFQKSDILSSRPEYNPEQNYNINGIPLTFDFTHDYEEDILLHHQCGGGLESKDFFQSFQFSRYISNLLASRLRKLPINFTGFHFRGNDMPNNPDDALTALSEISAPLFLASDSHVFINAARKKLAPKKIYSFSDIPNFSGRPIHHEMASPETKRQLNTDALLDLTTLAFSRNILFLNPHSGFSRLAEALNKIINASHFESIPVTLYFYIFLKKIAKYQANII